MSLGAFSVSLSVKDINASLAFYSTLGFAMFGGVPEQGWVILRNDDGVTIGLFQGMFEGNILTFNPGWAQDASKLEGDFTDVRALHKTFSEAGLDPQGELKEAGPSSFTLTDPDGNAILFDQHR